MTSVAHEAGRALRTSLHDEPLLETEEIQGNILRGFHKDHQAMLCFQIADVALAAEALRWLHPLIANAEDVEIYRRVYRRFRERAQSERTIEATWINVAFTASGLTKLLGANDVPSGEAFREGMVRRSALLGDELDERALRFGGASTPVDLLLIIAGDRKQAVVERCSLVLSVLRGINLVHTDFGEAPPRPFTSREHFGFRDGVSQPRLRGLASVDPPHVLTDDAGDRADLIWPGEFVLGYPQQRDDDFNAPGPVSEAGPFWTRNGSFVVFHRYEQDVERFRAFLETAAAALSAAHPAFRSLTPDAVAAKIVGRWFGGAPLVLSPRSDEAQLAEANDFGYRDDRFGVHCPHAAHIRKANPRDEVTGVTVARHRLLRRGIPFGPLYPAEGERGLLFLAYMNSIERQFEFIVRSWLNDAHFPTAGTGADALIGRSGSADRRMRIPFALPDGTASAVEIPLGEPWVRLTGGAYLFSPSLSGIRHIIASAEERSKHAAR
jgi:Dyp-type peroxidase family